MKNRNDLKFAFIVVIASTTLLSGCSPYLPSMDLMKSGQSKEASEIEASMTLGWNYAQLGMTVEEFEKLKDDFFR